MSEKLNLMLHCGARSVSREAVEQVVTPDATRTWQPIPHSAMIDTVQGHLERSGLRVVQEAHGLWGKDGERYFGLMQIEHEESVEDYSLVVGMRNSHDKSFPGGFAVGNGVFVCDNLSFSSEVVIARKHTRFIMRDLGGLVESAVGRIGELRVTQDQRIEQYKTTEISDGQAHDLVIQALDSRVVPVTRIPDVVKEWRTPRHPEFANAGKTVWRLFNAFTEIMKFGSLTDLPRRSQSLQGILDVTVKPIDAE